MNQSAATAELVTLLSDTLNQVSADRLTLAVKQAWRDAWVATLVFDTSLTFDSTIYQYTIPGTLSTIDAVYIKRDSSTFPEEISAELWEVIGGVLIFNKAAAVKIPSGYPLQLRGRYKLTASDSIPVANQPLQNYVVTLSGSLILKSIGFTKILSFLHNDTSISELIAFRNLIEQDLLKYRAQLQSSYVNG